MTKLKVTFVQPGGGVRVVEADAGMSLMEAALNNGIGGIPADCGGACSCATCHVYFSQEWFDRLAPRADDEDAMMECIDEPYPTSRLSCQIRLSEALDGIEVSVPVEG
jgi:ferredoxin, 2Fe-2S